MYKLNYNFPWKLQYSKKKLEKIQRERVTDSKRMEYGRQEKNKSNKVMEFWFMWCTINNIIKYHINALLYHNVDIIVWKRVHQTYNDIWK